MPHVEQRYKLRDDQRRILEYLRDCPKRPTRTEIVVGAAPRPGWNPKHSNWVGHAMGFVDPDLRKEHEQKNGFPSLLTLGYVEETTQEIEEGLFTTEYSITPAGQKALEEDA